jgi:prepilin-type processing-associated H-X9-DG protein
MVLGAAELKAPAVGGSPDYLADCPVGPYEFQSAKRDDMCGTLHFWSYHPGGANFANCDGSVHFVAYSIGQSILTSMATRSNGETFDKQ